ncbi:MAG: Spy/CpxP family protein refolding chaperone [Betaproteobacteria bacterium]|nr:Spy/CpxP family protein refolding chaperone [Betaproteobacteria bacterium]
MKTITRNKLATALFAAGLAIAAAMPASAAPGPGPGMREMTPEMQERMQSRMQARLDKMAERLEIKASQQDAWQAYAKVHKEMFDARPTPPAKDADAATLARHRADMAAKMAQKLTVLADATAKLQSALTPEQAKTLADMTRHPMGGRHGKHGGRGEQGSRGQMGGMGGMGGPR